jgi:hypothetical protein
MRTAAGENLFAAERLVVVAECHRIALFGYCRQFVTYTCNKFVMKRKEFWVLV